MNTERGIKLVAAEEAYADARDAADKAFQWAISTAKNAYVWKLHTAWEKYRETIGEIDKERREK